MDDKNLILTISTPFWLFLKQFSSPVVYKCHTAFGLVFELYLKGQTGYVRYLNGVCSVVDKFFRIHLKHKTFLKCIIIEFLCLAVVENHEYGWVPFQNRFFKVIKQRRRKIKQKLYSKLNLCLGTYFSNEICQ